MVLHESVLRYRRYKYKCSHQYMHYEIGIIISMDVCSGMGISIGTEKGIDMRYECM